MLTKVIQNFNDANFNFIGDTNFSPFLNEEIGLSMQTNGFVEQLVLDEFKVFSTQDGMGCDSEDEPSIKEFAIKRLRKYGEDLLKIVDAYERS